MNEDEFNKWYEQQRTQAVLNEFGRPADVFSANVAEKSGGLMSSLGYAFNSPGLQQKGEKARAYGDSLSPQGRDYTAYEKIAEFLGQAAPATTLGYITKSPYVASAVDAASEIGTIINELQRQGLSNEEIKAKLPEVIGGETISALASGTLGKVGLNLIKNKGLGGLGRKIFGAEMLGASNTADQPLQNLIYREATGR